MAQAAFDLPDAFWALVYSSSSGRISRVALDVNAPTTINADLSVGQEEVRYNLVEGGWFHEDRIKTLGALRRVTERMRESQLATVLDRVSIILAPSPWLPGETRPFGGPGPHSLLVYLSGNLEFREQAVVDSVVANEFAHVILHPMLPEANVSHPDQEHEADKFIETWGFLPAYSGEAPEGQCPACGALAPSEEDWRS